MNNELKQRLSLLVSHLKYFNLIESRIPGLEKVLAINFLSSGNIRIVRENKSIPCHFGLYLAQENDWVYISKQDSSGCIRLRVTADCDLDLSSLEDAHFPIVSNSVEITDLRDISELESKHMLARALLIDPVSVENALGVYLDDLQRQIKEHPEEAYQLSFGSYARLVIAAFRKLNIAHLLYESEPLIIDNVEVVDGAPFVLPDLAEFIQNKDTIVTIDHNYGSYTWMPETTLQQPFWRDPSSEYTFKPYVHGHEVYGKRPDYSELMYIDLMHTDGTVGVKENTDESIDWTTVVAWAVPVSE